ncbi:hypothetical protein DM02DRAFT_610649 [Periconia macrospinosa]|uniref:Uncharacterized protein n=1 Tax=Periconia macrospinosa TaxID=97972 RepID=A0A2V1E7Y2_9PLEO|nr:hypothetical protein DM02DRAFT_610649 [Periconia macrospinosa]
MFKCRRFPFFTLCVVSVPILASSREDRFSLMPSTNDPFFYRRKRKTSSHSTHNTPSLSPKINTPSEKTVETA